jgi:hypothetical protein
MAAWMTEQNDDFRIRIEAREKVHLSECRNRLDNKMYPLIVEVGRVRQRQVAEKARKTPSL